MITLVNRPILGFLVSVKWSDEGWRWCEDTQNGQRFYTLMLGKAEKDGAKAFEFIFLKLAVIIGKIRQ